MLIAFWTCTVREGVKVYATDKTVKCKRLKCGMCGMGGKSVKQPVKLVPRLNPRAYFRYVSVSRESFRVVDLYSSTIKQQHLHLLSHTPTSLQEYSSTESYTSQKTRPNNPLIMDPNLMRLLRQAQGGGGGMGQRAPQGETITADK